MRGSHYGADARWFGRAFELPGEIEIPELPKDDDPKSAASEKAALREGPSFLRRQHISKKLLGDAEAPTGGSGDPGETSSRSVRSRSPLELQVEQGAFRRAISATSKTGRPGRRLDPRSNGTIPRDVQQLLGQGILQGVKPQDLSLDDIERLRMALNEGGLRPSHGVQVMQAWARERRVPPEIMLQRLRQLRDEWLAAAPSKIKPNPGAPFVKPADWDREEQVSNLLGQRHNAGYGPKDIDHERMRLLQIMMSSFSGQVNYGFDNGMA